MPTSSTRFSTPQLNELSGSLARDGLKTSFAPPALDNFGVTRTRKDVDWGRKIFHVVGGCLIGGIYLGFNIPRVTGLWILGAIAVPFIFFDYMRLTRPGLNRTVHGIFGKIMRTEESHSLSTASWLFVSAWAGIFFFSREVAALAVVFVAFADPAASFFGVRYGRLKLPWGKTVEGTLGAFAAAAIAGLFFCQLFGLTAMIPLALVGALSAAIAETIPLGKIDDNFTIPLVSGLTMHFLL